MITKPNTHANKTQQAW